MHVLDSKGYDEHPCAITYNVPIDLCVGTGSLLRGQTDRERLQKTVHNVSVTCNIYLFDIWRNWLARLLAAPLGH